MLQIHSTAVVDKKAEIDTGVEIGSYTVVGGDVKIGAGTKVMSHVVLDGKTAIGRECTIFPFASIGTQTQDLKYKGGNTYVEIGDKNTVREYVTINSGTAEGDVTRVGSGCHIMAYSHIAHQCVIGNNVIISNAGTLGGHVIIEDNATIGGLCGVHQFVRIGRMSFIGGCSKVTKDIPPFMLADGNPARICSLNIIGLQRRNMPEEKRTALKQAFKILFKRDLSTKQALQKIQAELNACPELESLVSFISESERGISK